MPGTEYKVLPAPSKGRKGPGVKGAEARFSHALESLMNEMAAEGWHYLRSDMLPHEQRQGIRSSQTTYRSVLVFCREIPAKEALLAPAVEKTTPRIAPVRPVRALRPERPVQEHEEYHAEFSEPEPSSESGDPEAQEHESETPPERFT